MKIIKRILKIIIVVMLAIASLPSKIFASPVPIPYGPTLYGPAKPRVPESVHIIWGIASVFIIPITLLIGLIIYFKKSKSSKKKKILITIGILAITAILYLVIYNNI